MREKIGHAMLLLRRGQELLRETGEYDKCEELHLADQQLRLLAARTGATEPTGYTYTPDDWQTCYHQASLALAAAWNGGENAAINTIRGHIIDGLELYGSQEP